MRTHIFPLPLNRSLDQFSQELDRLMDTLRQPAVPRQSPLPALNVWEDEQSIVLEAELPGMAMEDIDLSIHGDQLTLRGQRKATTVGALVRQERWSGQFERTLTIPVPIDGENASAALEHGILTIRLPKAPSARPRRIQIGSGAGSQ
jgi:HSP20 family protein